MIFTNKIQLHPLVCCMADEDDEGYDGYGGGWGSEDEQSAGARGGFGDSDEDYGGDGQTGHGHELKGLYEAGWNIDQQQAAKAGFWGAVKAAAYGILGVPLGAVIGYSKDKAAQIDKNIQAIAKDKFGISLTAAQAKGIRTRAESMLSSENTTSSTGSSLEGEGGQEILMSVLSSEQQDQLTGGTTVTNPYNATDKNMWDSLMTKYFAEDKANDTLGYDKFGSVWEEKTGKSWDFTSAQGRQNWQHWLGTLGENPTENPEFTSWAKDIGMTPEAAMNVLTEAMSTSGGLEEMLQITADHAADAARAYESGAMDAVNNQDSSLAQLAKGLAVSRGQRDDTAQLMLARQDAGGQAYEQRTSNNINRLDAATQRQNNTLQQLQSDIQSGSGLYAPTTFMIGGQPISFVNRGARNTAQMISDLGQSSLDNTANFVNTANTNQMNVLENLEALTKSSIDNAQQSHENLQTDSAQRSRDIQAGTTDRLNTLKNVLDNQAMTNPAAADVAQFTSLMSLAQMEEQMRAARANEALKKYGIDQNVSVSDRQIDASEPGWADYLILGSNALGNLAGGANEVLKTFGIGE